MVMCTWTIRRPVERRPGRGAAHHALSKDLPDSGAATEPSDGGGPKTVGRPYPYGPYRCGSLSFIKLLSYYCHGSSWK